MAITSKVIALIAAAMCLGCASTQAKTHPQDIAALWKFKEEALAMSNPCSSTLDADLPPCF